MKTFDFRAIDAPKMAITLRTGLKLTLEVPTVSLVERVREASKCLSRAITEHNLGEIKTYYEITAELMSCNAEDITITAEDLETRQHLGIEHLVAFFTEYLEFIEQASNVKN